MGPNMGRRKTSFSWVQLADEKIFFVAPLADEKIHVFRAFLLGP